MELGRLVSGNKDEVNLVVVKEYWVSGWVGK